MRRFRSFICFVLVLTMILGIQVISTKNVSAAKKEFTNVKFENNVLTWDPIANVDSDNYKIKFTRKSIDFSRTTTTKENRFSFEFYFWKPTNNQNPTYMKSGSFKVTLTAKDTDGKSYEWKGTVDYVDTFVHQPTSLKWENGFFSWDIDRSNFSDDTIIEFYVSISIDGIPSYGNLNIYTTDLKIPENEFAITGTHDYGFYVSGRIKGSLDSGTPKTMTAGRTIDAARGLNNVKIENDILSWDAYPGADNYRWTYIRNGVIGGTTEIVTGTSKNLLKEFYQKDVDYVQIKVAAYNGNKMLTPSTLIDYRPDISKVVYYPLYVEGKQLDSVNYDDVLKGMATYDPAKKILTLDSFLFHPHGRNEQFKSTEDLTITGRIGSSSSYFDIPVFECDKTLTITQDFEIPLTSHVVALHAKNIVFADGNIKIICDKENNVIADQDITILPGCDIELQAAEGKAAILAGGKINMKGSAIVIPEGGKLDKDGKTIVNPDGTVASHVKIVKATPTPTAKPTAKATTAPNAKPTAKATTAPSVTKKPTVTIVPPSDPKSSILSFVERIYKYVLDREPEAEGAAFWTEELYSFRRTGAEVGMQFIFSEEFIARNLSNEDFVTVLYKTFFGRDPEEEGFKFWTSALADGTLDRQAVASGFIYSQEWADTCASYGIRSGGDIKPNGVIVPSELTYAFVERLYVTAMGRSYDEEGRQYWASELANFNITGEQAGAAFMLSDEMNSYGLSTEEYVKRLYKTFMDREPEEDGYAYWVGFLNDGNSREAAVLGFARSEEFVNKCIEARILPY